MGSGTAQRTGGGDASFEPIDRGFRIQHFSEVRASNQNNVYMKGATAELCAKMSRAPNRRVTAINGQSQYFLRVLIKNNNSRIKDISRSS
jgi:hypothetical protein